MALLVAFMLPLFGGLRLHGCRVSCAGQSADVGLGKVTASNVAFRGGYCKALSGDSDFWRSFWLALTARTSRGAGETPYCGWSVSYVLDTLTPVFELYVRLREIWQWDNDFCVWSAGVVLVGLHCSLACACGAVVGPFILDCETESGLLVVVLPVEVCPSVGTVVVMVGERRLTGCGFIHVVCPVVGTVVSRFCSWWRALWWHWFGCGFHGGTSW
ncbi:hypothetical protein Taro_054047 [Colocasia esculenta]|uniref:Secreted protein n=1 Tax=Colocasia esculenta TaxID=4460 RepID=A0A843XNW0_COLES|nr:hypothetical protein [Colocasia esculenta]